MIHNFLFYFVMRRIVFSIILFSIVICFAIPDQGKWEFTLDEQNIQVTVVKSLFKDSLIFATINCDKKDGNKGQVKVTWSLQESSCWQDYLPNYHIDDYDVEFSENKTVSVVDPQEIAAQCDGLIFVHPAVEKSVESSYLDKSITGGLLLQSVSKRESLSGQAKVVHNQYIGAKKPLHQVVKDGFYVFTLLIKADEQTKFSAKVNIEMSGKHGYLSAADWPLLPFYGSMCLVYVVLGLGWLVVSFLQWRDLLRIQFWIGGVILLGMLEMATFYAEYSAINSTGNSPSGAVLLAELVSCAKRTLARMLVIVVSLGFGIVKPRLGGMLHRVVGVGVLYFILAATEAYMRVMRPKSDPANQMLIASVPLAVLDSGICWWIFTSLVQTTRTLRLRRNLVKLALYRHFTNTLIFAVMASVIFMLYSIKAHHFAICFTDWKELWIDDAYWRFLFSVILLVIMILWRPTNNNQRYAFSPLLDAPEDDDDEEEEQFVNDAYGVKMRSQSGGANSPKPKSINNAEDDLKWVEENIPASLADTALPILDSEEEIMTTRFELSKMQ